ncbi:YdeI/OmpD-associated family protein [Sphingobacterium spiritivorum]|uniref:YdeI/OmpD-associated family protein n=1 Tax=Sphingobacterium spiritivorum TaxID=258 RepID=UPI003DA52DDD
MEEIRNGVKVIYAKSRAEWRQWLADNHQAADSVWLVVFRKESAVRSVLYSEAVEEALCYGWIDSLKKKREPDGCFQFFSKRKAKSNWSAVNKKKIALLIEQNLMTDAGLEVVDMARKNGMWDASDNAENLVIPPDLEHAFLINKEAYKNWESFSRTSKKEILKWIYNAKRPETRQRRIEETISLATENKRAK